MPARLRSVLAAVLLVIGVVLVPVGATATWLRTTVTDTDTYVATITPLATDPAVLARISSWGWQDGLRPGPAAPVWPMDRFRDRFLTAYGPSGGG